jgi:tetratricopeptide (TPR) repeat protein
LDNKPMLAEALGGAVSSYLVAGDLKQTVQAGEESLALSRSIGNRIGLAITSSFFWYVFRELGEIDRAIDLAEQALALDEQLGFLGPEWGAGVELAETYAYLGAFARAEEYGQAALDTADLVPSARPKSFPGAVLARLELRRGDRAAAERLLSTFPPENVEGIAAHSSPYAPSTTASAHIELALAQGRADRAIALADDLVALLDRTENSILVPSALHLRAQALKGLDRADEAYSVLREARRQAQAMELRYHLLSILVTSLEMEIERGDEEQTERVRRQARALIEYIADHTPTLWRESFLKLQTWERVMGR